MKGLNIKKIAAVGLGAALVGSAIAPIATAAFEGVTKDQFYSSDGSPTVNIVVGSSAKISDAVWAGNLAAKVASLAYTTTPVKTSVGTATGEAVTPDLEDVTVDLTIGGVTTVVSGATDDIRFDMNSNSTTEFDDQKDPSNSDGIQGQVRETDADLDFLRDETVTKRVGNVASDLTVQELIDIKADAEYEPDPDVEDLRLIIDSAGIKYRINLGAGLSAHEADGTDYLDDGASDKQELFFFGKLYQIRSIDIDPTRGAGQSAGRSRTDSFVELFEESNEKLYSEGDEITGLVGKGKYEGQEMKIVIGKGYSKTQAGVLGTSNVITLEIYDSQGNFVDSDEFAAGDDESSFTDELNDEVLESGLFVQEVNKRTDTGYVETFTARILVGSSRVELREQRGFPFDEDNTSNIFDWDITLIFAEDSDCNSNAAAQGSGCTNGSNTIDQNKLVEIQIFNDNLTFNSDDSYLRATGRAGGTFGALNPNNGFENVSMKTGEGEVFFTVEFGGFEFETMNTLKLGRGANDDTGYIEYQDEANRYHKIPMQVKNLVTTTASGAGRVFAFDNGAQDYYYEFRTDDQNIVVGDGNTFNGLQLVIDANLAGGGDLAYLDINTVGGRGDSNFTGGFTTGFNSCRIPNFTPQTATTYAAAEKNCVFDGMLYAVTHIIAPSGGQTPATRNGPGSTDNNAMVAMLTAGMLKIVQGTTVTQTSRPAPFDTTLNNAIYLDDGNVFEGTTIQLQGNGGTLFHYYPALVDRSGLQTGYILLAGFNGSSSAEYTTEDGGRWRLEGTSIPTSDSAENTGVFETTDRNYFAPDERNFSGGPGNTQGILEQARVAMDQTDSDFLTAVFLVDQGDINSTDYDFNVYIDTKDGRLVDAGNDQLTAPKVQVTYLQAQNTGPARGAKIWDLRYDQPETYQSRGYTDFGSLAETDGSVFTLTYPENTTEAVVYVFGQSEVEQREVGGTTQTLTEGQSFTDASGAKVTVTKVNVGSATCPAAATGACVATPSQVIAPGRVKLPLVYLDSDAPVGKNIIVGGPIVNSLAAEVSGLTGRLQTAGDVVAEVDATTGDVVLAGYTASDTGRAVQQFIDALDALS